MDNTVGSLTQLQRAVIIGSLLGDGYMRIVSGRANALLEINHCLAQKQYVNWKYNILKSICRSGPIPRIGNGSRLAYRFTTKQHEELTFYHNMFYKNKKKHIPRNIKLDPMILAVWYMDDGSKCRDRDVYINTQQFDLEDQKYCLSLLSELGIEGSLNKDKIYWRIRIKKSSLPIFFALISPHIIPSMMYKLSYDPVETCSERSRVFAENANANTPTPFSLKGEDIIRSSQ